MRTLRIIAGLVALTALVACSGGTKDASHTLYNTQLALNTAVQASDNALDAACTDIKSAKCGRMLTAHQQVLDYAKTATDALKAGRAGAQQGNDSAALQAVTIINDIIQKINAAVQAANQSGASLKPPGQNVVAFRRYEFKRLKEEGHTWQQS